MSQETSHQFYALVMVVSNSGRPWLFVSWCWEDTACSQPMQFCGPSFTNLLGQFWTINCLGNRKWNLARAIDGEKLPQ